jgi:NDP-sugar pyrophosphorylase family protein
MPAEMIPEPGSVPRRAAVLAGGLGTRLRPYTTVLPKPLVPVGDRPILELIFGWLARQGVREVDVCIGHLGELIQTYFSQAQTIPEELEVRWVWEDVPRGTAGALVGVPATQEALLVVNGDVLTDLDLAAMLAYHRDRDAALTIATRTNSVPVDLGVIEHRDDGRVTGYVEKPVLRYDASMGVYLYEPRALELLRCRAADVAVEFPDLVLALLDAGTPVVAFHSESTWDHVGTLDQHRAASISEKWLQDGHIPHPRGRSVG